MPIVKRRTARVPTTLVRPLVQRLAPYVPGEQPKIKGLIKLNTNENPYPPAPKVLKAVRACIDSRLRLYPNPTAEPLREKLAHLHGCCPENIIVGNGSDELLAMAVRCFVEPLASGKNQPTNPRGFVQFFTPSYSLYPVLAQIHGAVCNPVPLRPDFSLPDLTGNQGKSRWRMNAAMTFITTPNAPSGKGYSTRELEKVCRHQRGVVVLDEAYVDFAKENALSLGLKYRNVIVLRTFSKAYSLCFQRVGYGVGHPELIDALHKIRDSYNVNGLGQIAAAATLENLPYYQENFRKIILTRQKLGEALTALGFWVCPSQTNFILIRPPRFSARQWMQELRRRKILVRWFDQPETRDFLRITIGTEAQTEALIRGIKDILRK